MGPTRFSDMLDQLGIPQVVLEAEFGSKGPVVGDWKLTKRDKRVIERSLASVKCML